MDEIQERLRQRCAPALLDALALCEKEIGEHAWTEPALLLWALLELDPDLVEGLDRDRLRAFARELCECPGRLSRAGIWELLVYSEGAELIPADLLPQLWRSVELNYFFWSEGRFSPYASTPDSGGWTGPGWLYPGASVASWLDQKEITGLHQLLEGLSHPRYQLSFGEVRRRISARFQEVHPASSGSLRMSAEASANLARLVPACLEWNVEPSSVHLAYLACCHPDSWTLELLDSAELAAIQGQLKRDLFGEIPEGPFQVDGSSLGQPPPVNCHFEVDGEGRIVYLHGKTLGSGERRLLDDQARFEVAESLLGWDRVGRWVPVPQGWLRVCYDQSMLGSVELACLRPA